VPSFTVPRPDVIRKGTEEDWLRDFARLRFLELVGELVPSALDRLKQEVWPEFCATLERIEARQSEATAQGRPYRVLLPTKMEPPLFPLDEVSECPTIWYEQVRAVDPDALRPFESVFNRWREDFHLTVEWFHDAALRTMLAWKVDPTFPPDTWLIHRPGWSGALSDEEMRFRFEATWEPTTESETSASTRIQHTCAEELKRFFAERKRMAKKRGFVDVPRPREQEQHLKFLVRYQVGGESYTDIARSLKHTDPAESGRKAVAEAVTAVAKRIGLPVRLPAKGGHQKDTKA